MMLMTVTVRHKNQFNSLNSPIKSKPIPGLNSCSVQCNSLEKYFIDRKFHFELKKDPSSNPSNNTIKRT